MAAPLAQTLLADLARAGLATRAASGWSLAHESGLPDAGDILQSFAADHPEASADILLASQALASLPGVLRTGSAAPLGTALSERFESATILLAPVFEAAASVCAALQARVAPDALRVLVAEPACLGVLHSLAGLMRDGRVAVSVIGTDPRRLNLARARHGEAGGIGFLDADADDVPDFDLALCLALAPMSGDVLLGQAIARRLAPGGLLCVLQPPASPVFDCLLGAQDEWFAQAPQTAPLGRIAAARDGRRWLQASGLKEVATHALGEDVGSLVVGHTGARLAAAAEAAPVLLLQDWPDLADALQARGHAVQRAPTGGLAQAWPAMVASGDGQAALVFLAQADGQGGLAGCLARLAAVFNAAQSAKSKLWVVVRGLYADHAAAIDPLAEAVWSFARVAVNEYPGIELRLVDLAQALDPAAAAQHMAVLIAAPGNEAELLVDASGVSAVRLLPAPPASAKVAAVRLQPGPQGALSGFDWVQTPRRAPDAGEVELRITAAGLNFRDVMLAGGLLDDDVLDDGMAGAVLGFECAGEVLRVGDGVGHLQPGDAVMGFGRESFATHATADARVFVRVPDGVAPEAAATIPVAFLTAWYALVHMAQIQPGEWVLIHGAAGGVGLAALQVARLRGARVAATVGSPEKRALVAAFGAERIYNSRSTAFADEIRADIGGVDLVLNSLAGEAMQAGLRCLRPFGRFVELGKRDYVANTALGLRPFRRNLSYFGVDLDQLLAANFPLVERLLAEIAGHFAAGTLSPLPYQTFDWHEAAAAFRLMQSGGHVGKILIRPAARPIATILPRTAFRPADGAHLVVGGTGGFGFETACWLAELGAATVVVASRSGVLAPALQARAEALRAGGITLLVEPLDVTDAAAVTALVGRMARSHGRVAGVIHAAVVLDDALIVNLEPHRLARVLAPKVTGADNLDRATRGAALDYFVAYSSVAAMVGNPGQAAYAAANGYLQGLMARRRAAGLPGLAVGWGAISDAGLLARDPQNAARLARLAGIEAMTSRAALFHLETLLGQGAANPASVQCALFHAGEAQRFKLLRTPAFAGLFAGGQAAAEREVDLATRIAGKSDGDARALVAALVAADVGRIFRLPPDEVEMTRPLDELGLDSMMSLDLRMSIEKRFGIELPVMAISAGVSVNELAGRLIASLRAGGQPADDASQQIMQRHGIQDASLPAGLAASASVSPPTARRTDAAVVLA